MSDTFAQKLFLQEAQRSLEPINTLGGPFFPRDESPVCQAFPSLSLPASVLPLGFSAGGGMESYLVGWEWE